MLICRKFEVAFGGLCTDGIFVSLFDDLSMVFKLSSGALKENWNFPFLANGCRRKNNNSCYYTVKCLIAMFTNLMTFLSSLNSWWSVACIKTLTTFAFMAAEAFLPARGFGLDNFENAFQNPNSFSVKMIFLSSNFKQNIGWYFTKCF